MHRHVHAHPGLISFLVARRARVISLSRENLLEQLVSRDTAVERERFHAHPGDTVAQVSVRIDVEELSSRLARRDGARQPADTRRTHRRHGMPAFETTYERLAASPHDELARIAGFLDVEPREWLASSTLVRMNTASWRAAVQNADEVEAALAGTAHAWMLGPP
jgi:LPS sulfotransferase NodH